MDFLFNITPLGSIFSLVASSLWILASIYTVGYMRGAGEKNQTRFVIFYSIAIHAALAIAWSGNLLMLFIFYEILTFSTLFVILSKFILPKISKDIEFRKSQILENIEAAEKQREDSDAKLKEYDEIISKSKLEANSIFNQAREKALKDIGAKREVLDKQIDNEIAEAEKEIDALRKNAPDKINKIAIETSSELLQKLIGAEVNNSSISAIVDDLSKRNGDKYYGN